jgi:hypothetical protein
MDYSSILDVHSIAHYYAIHIAAHHRVEPYTALIAHHHIA